MVKLQTFYNVFFWLKPGTFHRNIFKSNEKLRQCIKTTKKTNPKCNFCEPLITFFDLRASIDIQTQRFLRELSGLIDCWNWRNSGTTDWYTRNFRFRLIVLQSIDKFRLRSAGIQVQLLTKSNQFMNRKIVFCFGHFKHLGSKKIEINFRIGNWIALCLLSIVLQTSNWVPRNGFFRRFWHNFINDFRGD